MMVLSEFVFFLSHSQKIVSVSLCISAALGVIAHSNDLSQKCQKYAVPSLCHYAFPLCDETSLTPRPRQICRDECEALEQDICKSEYIVAKQHPLIGEREYICMPSSWLKCGPYLKATSVKQLSV